MGARATSRRSAPGPPPPAGGGGRPGAGRGGRARLAAAPAPGLAALPSDPAEVTAELVGRAADAGDTACQAVLDRAWMALGAMCAGLVNGLKPEGMVLG